jgi:two-component system LytT family response regulator
MTIFKKKYGLNMLRTVIIDDEAHMRQTLENLVHQYCPIVEVVAKADGVESGELAIRRTHPDLALLDIRMEDGTGFDLLKKLDPIDFKVIFITAYDEFAIRAFRFSALDYLLKPVDPDELIDAVRKADATFQGDFNTQLDALSEHLKLQDKTARKLIVKTSDFIHLLCIQDIFFCESDGSYTNIYLADGSKITASAILRDYEDMLADYGFFRVHKSYLINVRYIQKFERADGGYVIIKGDHKVPVASRKKEMLLEMFDRLANI